MGDAKKQLNSLIVQLSEAKMKISLLEDARKAQDQQIDELNAEIVFLKAKLRGAELASGPPALTLSSPSSTLPVRVSWAGPSGPTTLSADTVPVIATSN